MRVNTAVCVDDCPSAPENNMSVFLFLRVVIAAAADPFLLSLPLFSLRQ